MSKLKKISIFIDSYNDVDHITPFVDYLLSNKKAKITLYKRKTSNLIGDTTKAYKTFGFKPKTKIKKLIEIMMKNELNNS